MRRLIHSAAAISAAFLALVLFAGAVRSGAATDPDGPGPAQAAVSFEHTWPESRYRVGPGSIQSAPEYSLTRIVTITVYTTAAHSIPGLKSRWQIDMLSQELLAGAIGLPSDASDITVALTNGAYSIDYAKPAIVVTNSQGLYYEYRTDQQAQRFGNQILVSQTYKYNRPLHYAGTVIFTDPYQYLGYSGYAPTQINATRLHWDESFTEPTLHQFEAATWLVDLAARPRPDLEIVTATLDRWFNHVHVTASIRNNGPMTAGAPAFINLYDRLAPSVLPAGPLDLAGGWCTLDPVTMCGGSTRNRLPAVPPTQTVIFTAEYDLREVNGRHDIYLFVDALGGSENLGLNYESAEGNNSKLAGSLIWYRTFIFLPLMRRE